MLKKIINENSIKSALTVLLIMALGWLASDLASKNQGKQAVYYISQNELVALEKERLAKTEKADLFDGRTSQATELINEIAKEYERQGLLVIFTKDEAKGTHVFSLSRKVHEETIKKLNQLIEEEKYQKAPE